MMTACVQVLGRRSCETIPALEQPASEKRVSAATRPALQRRSSQPSSTSPVW